MTRERLLWLVLAGTLVRLWLFPLPLSFWLDETLTASAVHSGPSDFFSTWQIRNQSIAYVLFEWLWSRLAGTSEIALRLPSVAAAVAALLLVYRAGVRWKDRELGLTCAILFASLPHLVIEVPNARPYAVALLLSIAALGSLDRPWRWAMFASAAVYFHSLFILPLILQSVIVVRRPRGMLAFGAALTTLLPLTPVFLQLHRLSGVFSYWEPPTFSDLATYITPGFAVAVVVVVALAFGLLKGTTLQAEPVRLGLLTGVLPIVVLFMAARLFSVSVFVDRYVLVGAPGIVVLWAGLVRDMRQRWLRTVVFLMALINVNYWSASFGWIPDYRAEDWRGAVDHIQPGLTLLGSGLAETSVQEWLKDPKRWTHLAAPVVVYRPEATPQDTWLIPFARTQEGEKYVETLLDDAAVHSRINVLVRAFPTGSEWLEYIRGSLVSRGFAPRQFHSHGRVALAVFERR